MGKENEVWKEYPLHTFTDEQLKQAEKILAESDQGRESKPLGLEETEEERTRRILGRKG